MKKVSLFLFTIMFLAMLALPVEAKTGTKAWLNGYIVDENVPVMEERGKIYVPVDKIAEYYGRYAREKSEFPSLFIYKPTSLDSGDVLVLEQGSNFSADESEQIVATYSESPRVRNGHYYQTLRDASKAFDRKITYDKINNILVLSQDYYPGKAPSIINIVVDGREMPQKFKPFVQGGRTMIPVRFVTEAIQGQVYWHEKRTLGMQGLTIYRSNDKSGLTMYLNRCGALVSGLLYRNDTFPTLRSETTYVPLRFVADYLGITVSWDNETKTAYLTSGGVINMSGYVDPEMRERFREILMTSPEEASLAFD